MDGGVLAVSPGITPGELKVTVTATSGAGKAASLDFHIALALPNPVPLFSAADPEREGFTRVINHSNRAGAVRIDAVDDTGRRAGPSTLAMPPRSVLHFNTDDLENGNRGKRLTGATGGGEGDWRLRIASGLDIEVLTYIRTADGFVTATQDVAPRTDGEHRVAIFNPGSNVDQVSLLRLVNPGTKDAAVTISGVDDEGVSPGSDVEFELPAGTARSYTAADLEAGDGVDGGLGDGTEKWQLTVSADQPIQAMSLLESPGGHLTNLSTVPAARGGTHAVPLFPSASDEHGRQGFLRVINRGNAEATVGIAVYDETDRAYDRLTLAVDAGKTVHLNSDDLESGNTDKGLSGRTGAGEGDWRLEMTSEADIDVLAYVRATDGYLTAMHDVVHGVENRHEVGFFNPGRNGNQVSRLRLINAGEEPAEVTITGTDDRGDSSTPVRTRVPAGTVKSFTAAELETGTADLAGALGRGTGKWRLSVQSDRTITVMNLLETPTGHLTNLSTGRNRATP